MVYQSVNLPREQIRTKDVREAHGMTIPPPLKKLEHEEDNSSQLVCGTGPGGA